MFFLMTDLIIINVLSLLCICLFLKEIAIYLEYKTITNHKIVCRIYRVEQIDLLCRPIVKMSFIVIVINSYIRKSV